MADKLRQLGASDSTYAPAYDDGTPYVPAEQVAEPTDGAPAEFGGMVIPNPEHVKPEPSEGAVEPTELTGGATLQPIENVKKPSAMKPFGGMEAPAPAEPPKTHVPPSNEQALAKQIQVNKDDALKEGGISGMTKLGAALVQEKELHKTKAMQHVMEAAAHPMQVTPESGPLPKVTTAGSEPEAKGFGIGAEKPMNSLPTGGVPAVIPAVSPEPPLGAVIGEPMPDVGLGSATPTPKYTGMLPYGKTAPEQGQAIPAGETQTIQNLAAAPKTPEELNARREELKAASLAAKSQGDLTKSGAADLALAELDKQNPYGSAANHPGLLGRIEHGLAKAGNIAGDIVAPNQMAMIPGTDLNRQARTAGAEKEIAQGQEGELKAAQAEAQREAAAVSKNQDYEQVKGVDDKPLMVQGFPVVRSKKDNSMAILTPQGPVPIKSGQNTAFDKPVASKEGDMPATPEMMKDVTSRINGNPYIAEEKKAELAFPEGYTPTQNEVKERLANIKDLEDATRAGKQDETNNQEKKIRDENENLLAQAHLQDLQDKKKKSESDATMANDVGYAGLYAQKTYDQAMKDWYKSGHFAKDSGLVTEIVNKEHSSQGNFNAALGGGLVGSLLGPEGAAAGAAVGTVGSLLSGPVNGYLDSLKKQGISDEGYKAMQAYFNALPPRFNYEIGVQGLKASAMRSAQLIQKVLNTVPPPNTPQTAWDNSFAQYYHPMETLTEKKAKLTAPDGYTPPKYEDMYPKGNETNTNTGGASEKSWTDPKTNQKVVLRGREYVYEQSGKPYVPPTK